MDYSVFESRVIELMFKTDARIIPAYVAYRVGCAVETARQRLEEMTRQGVVTMEVDEQGVVFFEMPGRPPATNEPLSWTSASGAALGSPAAVFADATAMSMSPQQVAYGYPQGPVPLQVQINNVPAAEPRVVVVGHPKSIALAVLASLFFGPLGMLYSTVGGALVMFLVDIFVLGATAGAGLIVTLPLGAIWAASAASQHNARMARAFW